ncbi:sensor histidine kinase [Streptomyces sp. NPDC087263]|uniref:sensor histidine kinase n=1 Tax=Streptomyces sp. NPDC087263 TaxID=3365773 RepID=UPI00380B214A
MSDTSVGENLWKDSCVEDMRLAAELLACEPELLDIYRSGLVEQENPLGINAEAWDSCRDQVSGILSECRSALENDGGAALDRRSPQQARLSRGTRIAQGTVPVQAVHAGSLLVQLVAEFLERLSLTGRPYSGRSLMRLMAMLQAAVTRRFEGSGEGGEGADGYGPSLLDVPRDSTIQSCGSMAREVHDRIGSAASLALRQLELYELARNVSSATDPRLDSLKQAILETMHGTRDIVTELRTRAHPVGSLETALSAFVTAMEIDEPVVDIRIEDFDEPLPETIGDNLFLVLRECLRNALAHARASRVTLYVRSDARRLRASVTDDGVGLPEERKFGNGLASMAERIRSLGGRMEIKSAPGCGTTLEFSVPMGEAWHAVG